MTTYVWEGAGSASTDKHGEFWFTGLDAGTYEVVEPGQGDWDLSTKQPTQDPNSRDDGDKNPNTKGIDPADATTALVIESRKEWVWAGAASRPIDGMGGAKDGKIDDGERLAGYNMGGLKNETLAPASFGQPSLQNDLWFGNFKLGSIEGVKYEDVNGNGKFDNGEPALQGVVFKLDGGAVRSEVHHHRR